MQNVSIGSIYTWFKYYYGELWSLLVLSNLCSEIAMDMRPEAKWYIYFKHEVLCYVALVHDLSCSLAYGNLQQQCQKVRHTCRIRDFTVGRLAGWEVSPVDYIQHICA